MRKTKELKRVIKNNKTFILNEVTEKGKQTEYWITISKKENNKTINRVINIKNRIQFLEKIKQFK